MGGKGVDEAGLAGHFVEDGVDVVMAVVEGRVGLGNDN